VVKRIILLIALVFIFNTVCAQKALKILKDDGSITYINASAVNKITLETPLAIGDTYQGGIIFYIDASGEHGLIAAPTDQSTGIVWYNNSVETTTGATRDGIGAGDANTNIILGNQGIGSYAAYLCDTFTLGSYTDWYLPSKYELNLMYTNLKLASLGGFGSGFYWSSTESNSFYHAWAQNFTSGYQDIYNKYRTDSVRAIRAF